MIIVHVLTRLSRAGTEENTMACCLEQHRAGHRIIIVHGPGGSPIFAEQYAGQFEFVELQDIVWPISPWHDGRAVLTLAKMLREWKADLVHTHQSKAGVIGRVAARLARVPKIVHGVHIVPFQNAGRVSTPLYIALEKFCARFTNLFIHVSPGTLDQYRQADIGQDKTHVVIESGMDVAKFRDPQPPHDRDLLVRGPSGAGKPFVVVSLAALEERKRLRQLLPIFANVVRQHSDAVLLLAGTGPLQSELEADIAALGLTEHVRLIGFREDPERLLAIADAVVLASEREGLPRVVVQAAMAGVPAVTTDLPGIDLIVRDGQTGYVVPVYDLSKIEPALLSLIGNPAQRAEMSRQLRERDYSAWDRDNMAKRTLAVYERLPS